MITKRLNIYKRLGITLMSAIMLSGIAPSLSNVTANASNSKHMTYRQTLVTKKRRMRNTHRSSTKRLRAMKYEIAHLRHQLKEKRGRAKNNIRHQLQRKQRNYIITIHQNVHQAWLMNEYQKALNRLQRLHSQDVNKINDESLRITNLANNNRTEQRKLQKMHVQYYNQIRNLMNQQNNNQHKIQQLEQARYQPNNVPKIVNFANKNSNLTKRIYRASNLQYKPQAKAIVKAVARNENKTNHQLHNKLEGEEQDHLSANTKYIQRLNYENKIINYGLNYRNKPIYNESINQLDNMKAFDHATASGRKLERQAKNRENSIKRNIGDRVKGYETGVNRTTANRTYNLLNSWASNDNSEAQYDENHETIGEVLRGIHNPKKRRAIERKYNNIKKHKRNYKKYKNLYNNRHKRYRGRKYRYHINKRGLRKYHGVMSKLNRLKATKQTKRIKAEEKVLYKQAQADRKQQVNDISSQIDMLSKEITQQQAQYQKIKERWQDVNGNIPLRIQYHNQMDAVKSNIQQLVQQIKSLEGQAAKIDNDMNTAEQENEKQKYHHFIYGNVKSVQNVSHPKYVRISARTYYFNGYDISNRHQQDMRVQPNSPRNDPIHYVNSASKVTLTDGTSYLLYNINSNMQNAQYSYYVLARYTTPVQVQPFKLDVRYEPAPKNVEAISSRMGKYQISNYNGTNGNKWYNSVRFAGRIYPGEEFHVLGVYVQRGWSTPMAYKVVSEKDGVFNDNTKSKYYNTYHNEYGHKIMYISPTGLNVK